jgi:integrase
MGSIRTRTLANGARAYLARYRATDGKEHTRQFSRKKDAESFLAANEHALESGSWIDPDRGKLTLAEYYAEWEKARLHLKPTSRSREASLWRTHIAPEFGDRELARIEREHVKAWAARLAASTLASDTVGKAVRLLGQMLREAVDDRRIAQNPAERIKMPRPASPSMQFLTKAQLDVVVSHVPEHWRPLVRFLGWSGLRFGEAAGLRWADVDLARGRVTVRGNLVEDRGALIYQDMPKSRAGRRVVPIPTFIAQDLAALTQPNPEFTDLVFHTPDGSPVRVSNFRDRIWKPAVRSAGFTTLRLHDLRHTAISFWADAGLPMHEVSKRAGHSSISTTFDRYSHLFEHAEEKFSEALDRYASCR